MKIGIEVQRLFRMKKFGIEISSLELIKKLKEIEPSHKFVIFAKNDEDRACLETSGNVKIKLVAGKLFADFEQFFLPLAVRREGVDILHCTGNTTPYFCSAPIVQTLHDVIFMDDISETDSYYQRFGNHYRRKMVPIVTPRSQIVITVSEYEKERIIQRLGIADQKIHVVYNGLDEKRFYPRPYNSHVSVKRKYDLPEDFILFLGNTSFRKNADRVIEAYVQYSRKSDNPMALVAPGLTQDFIINKLSKYKFPFDKQKFITPGYILDQDLSSIYGLSKIFLFPSISEGFGMPVIEAMACGSPVITSNTSSMPEIAGNAAILVDPSSASSIADALLSLSGNESLRLHKIEKGFSNATRFNWTASAEKVLSIYERVLKRVQNPQTTAAFLRKEYSTSKH